MTVHRSLRARWVLPIDAPPIKGGCVVLSGNRIAGVTAGPRGDGRVEDLGDVALLPGLVNAHTHLEFSDLARPLGAPGMSLPAWIRLVIAERKRGGHDAAAAVAAGLDESIKAGVTMIGEICASPDAASIVADRRPELTAFQESIGFSTARVDSAFADVARRFEAAASPAGLSPHAPYTVHPRLLERIVALAIERGAPMAMHLAESPEELQLLASGDGEFRSLLDERSMWDAGAIPLGWRPMNYLQRLAEAPRALIVHGNYLAADEIDFLGQRRATMSVAYCPRTHAYFGHAAYPLEAMLAGGVRVALGTDSRASNPDLDMLSELRFAAKTHSRVAPAELLKLATLAGAEALDADARAGSLTPGKRADLIAIDCNAKADPAEAILAGGRVRRVWIGGESVREN
jgi:cytosine/adenosine deaminase-related metal-dependent hydrolase